MKRNVDILRHIAHLLYELLFTVFLMTASASLLFREEITVRGISLVAAFYVLSYITRVKIQYLYAIAIWHIAFLAGTFFMPLHLNEHVFLSAVFIVLMRACVLYVAKHRGLPVFDELPWLTFLLCMIIYAAGYFYHIGMLVTWSNRVVILLLVLYFAVLYLDGLKRYLDSSSSVEGIPLAQIVSVNTMIVGGIIGLFLISVLASFLFHIDDGFAVLAKGIAALAGLIIYGIIYIFGKLSFTETGTDDDDGGAADMLFSDERSSLLEDVFMAAARIALVVLAVYLLYRIFVRLLRLLHAKQERALDTSYRQKSDVCESIEKISVKRRTRRKTEEEKIRALYKKYIMRNKGEMRLGFYKTSREYECELAAHDTKNIHEITEIYNHVRYGNDGFDKTDTKRVKRLVKP